VEIAPVPHRATRGEWRRLALGMVVLFPVVLLVLLPAVLGLGRFVVTEEGMDGSLGRGAVVLAREVPPSDLRTGDVISFRPPGQSDERVIRRIVAIEHGVAVTRADATDTADPWRLRLTDPSYSRVELGVPWVGYPFVAESGWVLLTVPAGAALLLALLAGPPRPTQAVVKPTRAGLPVG
jgi:signal peptidase